MTDRAFPDFPPRTTKEAAEKFAERDQVVRNASTIGVQIPRIPKAEPEESAVEKALKKMRGEK